MSDEPEDVGGRVYAIFYLLGVGQMLPWNVFINANAYFKARFSGSAYSSNFQNFFSLAFQVVNVLVVILASKYNSMLSPRIRMVVPLICNSLAFMLTTGMVLYEHIDPVAMFYVTIVTCVAAGTFMAVLQSGVFSLAAQFPQKYSQAVMGGQGMAGVSVALVFTLAAYVQPGDGTSYEDQKWSSFACFGTASAFVLSCTMFYIALERSEYGQHHANFTLVKQDGEFTEKLLGGKLDVAGSPPLSPAQQRAEAAQKSQGVSLEEMVQVYKLMMPSAWAVFGVFFVTLGLYPSMSVVSGHPGQQ
jgi:equilibrative nucleoside transporter 1/2/3